MKPDDSVSGDQLSVIRLHAQRVLEAAGAAGCIPTPVAQVMEAAKLAVSPENVLDEGFLAQVRNKVTGALKRAISKVLGVIDIRGALVYVDRTVLAVKQTFLKLHETGHFVLPWQRRAYALVEDCEKTLDPEISEQFDREANAFASEVLFQLDTFTREAADYPIGWNIPLKLCKKYDASIYSTVRRYVSTSYRACAVLVLNPPELQPGDGFSCTLRRAISSPAFEKLVSNIVWPERITPDDDFGAFVPLGKRRMSRPRSLTITNQEDRTFECVAEAFTQKYQVFILIHSVTALHRRFVLASEA